MLTVVRELPHRSLKIFTKCRTRGRSRTTSANFGYEERKENLNNLLYWLANNLIVNEFCARRTNQLNSLRSWRLCVIVAAATACVPRTSARICCAKRRGIWPGIVWIDQDENRINHIGYVHRQTSMAPVAKLLLRCGYHGHFLDGRTPVLHRTFVCNTMPAVSAAWDDHVLISDAKEVESAKNIPNYPIRRHITYR